MRRQGEGETDTGAQTMSVEGRCKIVVVQAGLHLRITSRQPEFARAHWKQQGHHHLDTPLGDTFSTLGYPPGV